MSTKDETIKYLTQSEREMLFKEIENDTGRHALRNRALFKLAYYCALRIGEPGLMMESDIDLYNRKIYCHREKNSHNNMIRILDPDLLTVLNDYLQVKPLLYPATPLLFPSQKGKPLSRQMIDHLMRSYCANSPIPADKHHFHVLKHTRAVDLANLGFDVKEVQWWLGHRNINNTMIYMQFTTKQQEVLYQKYYRAMKIEH